MRFIKHLYDNFEEYVSALCMATMIFALVVQTVWRVFTGSSFAWTEELSRYAFIWGVFFAVALAVKRGAHVRITAQFMPFGTGVRLFFRFLSDLLWIGFNVFFVCVCWDTIQEGFEFPEMSPTLHIVKAKIEMIIPASFLLTSWRIVEDYFRHWRAGTLADMVRYEEIA